MFYLINFEGANLCVHDWALTHLDSLGDADAQ